ncbi:hypothetical protein [Streptomyces sp. NRRL B-1347]|uniref:hypothetical protein n=1 Tax=Streptomyces sp. NRRL B-1347 TaxID=1476877 RepID=UPI0004CB2028|nr:hypothetical protein [Streptomyces sp. NRRL B-1347]
MSVRITLHCNTIRGFSGCAASLLTHGLTTSEARTIGAAYGWRHTGGRDYCPGCSGTDRTLRVVLGETMPTPRPRADELLRDAEAKLLALANSATPGRWAPAGTPATVGDGLFGVEFITGGEHKTECVARTGPAGNTQAAADAAYIAALDPHAGRAVASVLHEAFESVHQDGGLVQDSLSQAAVDLAAAIFDQHEGDTP